MALSLSVMFGGVILYAVSKSQKKEEKKSDLVELENPEFLELHPEQYEAIETLKQTLKK